MEADGRVTIVLDADDRPLDSKVKKANTSLKTMGDGAGNDIASNTEKNMSKATKSVMTGKSKMDENLKKGVAVKVEDRQALSQIKNLKDYTDKIKGVKHTDIHAEVKGNASKEIKRIFTDSKELNDRKFHVNMSSTGDANRKIALTGKQVKRIEEKKHDIKMNASGNAESKFKGLNRSAEQATKTTSRLKDVIAGSFIGGMAISGLSAIKNAMQSVVTTGLEFNRQQDTMRTVWHSLTTEAPKDGEHLIDFINQTSQHSIYAAGTLDKMAQSFYHVHSSEKETKNWTKDFIALGSTLHMSNEALQDSGEQFAKIVAGGKASAEDMSVMINRFPMFGEALQKATGKSMKQLYAMSAAGKLTAKQFTDALTYLGKKYQGGTAEAMTSFQGMTMYLKSRWQVLTGDITKSSFNMNKDVLKDMKNLLSNNSMKQYAKLASDAIGVVTGAAVKVIKYIDDHHKTIIDLLGNLGKIAGIIGKTVWQTFGDVLSNIAKAFGLTSKNGKQAMDPLEALDDITKTMAEHQKAVQNVTKALLAIWAVKKVGGAVVGLSHFINDLALVKSSTIDKLTTMFSKGGTFDIKSRLDQSGVQAGWKDLSMKSKAWRIGIGVAIVGDIGYGIYKAITSKSNDKRWKYSGQAIGETLGTAIGGAVGGPGGAMIGAFAGSKVGGKMASDAEKGWDSYNSKHPFKVHFGSPVASFMQGLHGGLDGHMVKLHKHFSKKYNIWDWLTDWRGKGNVLGGLAANVGLLGKTLFAGISKAVNVKKWVGDLRTKVRKAADKNPSSKIKILKSSALQLPDMKKVLKNFHPIKDIKKKFKGFKMPNLFKGFNPKKSFDKRTKGFHPKKTIEGWFTKVKISDPFKKFHPSKWFSKSISGFHPTRTIENWFSKVKVANPFKKFHPIKWFKSSVSGFASSWGTWWKSRTKSMSGQMTSMHKSFSSMTRKISSKFSTWKTSFGRGWRSFWSGLGSWFHKLFSKTIPSHAASGFNKVVGVLNGGIGKINSVIHAFGGSSRALGTIGKVHFATGTNGRRINSLTHAVVNDGSDVAGGGNKEIIMHHDGNIEPIYGRNVVRELTPGDEVLNASQAKQAAPMLGLSHFASGSDNAWDKIKSMFGNATSWVKDETTALAHFVAHPVKSLENLWGSVTSFKGSDFVETFGKAVGHKFMDSIKGSFSKLMKKLDITAGLNNPGGAGVMRWKPYVIKASKALHHDPSSYEVNKVLSDIRHESNGNPTVQNNWDINAKNGTPSIGLLQFIQPTFDHYAVKGHNKIRNGYDQLLAGWNDSNFISDINPGGGWGPSGHRRFALGGVVDRLTHAIIGEDPQNPHETIVNEAKPTADGLLSQSIAERAKQDPHGLYANLMKISQQAAMGQVNMSNQVSRNTHLSSSNDGSLKELVKAVKSAANQGNVYMSGQTVGSIVRKDSTAKVKQDSFWTGKAALR